ncbi:hypothetical protein FHS55_003476 [Angulomicrobium tetraedrale]|uniref:Flagellar biosynthesis protein FliO n=1 Tax=Ancylobacter tetraedralis TaxID=217068 RepID=A0A839ZDI1_9HYPH|nr:hypothetical protein [Ancylobacter tetraedralis]MBB3772851.1 hypothetical protein [Ancylobacter tetraedralis]
MLDSLMTANSNSGLLLVAGGVLLLILLVVLLGRRKRRQAHTLAVGHRLAIVDQVPIDETRRLVLIQRDDIQHLVILGGGSDFLVESGIPTARTHAAARIHDAGHPAAPAHAQPPAQPVAQPPAPIPAVTPVDPTPEFARPAPVRPAPPRAGSAEPAARPLDVMPMPLVPASATPAAPRAPSGPDIVRQRATPQARPEPATRGEPALEAPPPPPADQVVRVAIKVDPQSGGMAEQLEEALRRPTNLPNPLRGLAAAGAAAAPVTQARVAPEIPPITAGPEGDGAPIPEVLPPAAAGLPESRTPEVLSPSAIDRPAGPIDDSFEAEMASLLGRARRGT